MFYDYAKIFIKAGNGGNGAVAFRREKYVPEGGPSGGHGGTGGSVILVADEGLRTLVDFRYKRHFTADNGENGRSKNMNGSDGEDMIVKVPIGTVIKNVDTNEVIADLVEQSQEFVVAAGGRGGRGNRHFVSSVNRVPQIAENGDEGEEKTIVMELKLLADVGLAGFPNVGKSTIISHVSSAKPKIANFHFTTIDPNLGVVRLDEGKSFVLVDIPGLIEGASEGIGLGHRFLRHVERTRLILHVLDISGSEGRDPLEDLNIINKELELYNPGLKKRKQILVANKIDLTGSQENLERLKEATGDQYEIFPVSAVTGEGLKELMYYVGDLLDEIPATPLVNEEPALRTIKVEREEPFSVTKEDDAWSIHGPEVLRHYNKTNFGSEFAMKHFLNIMRKIGIEKALRDAGAEDGDTVRIYDFEFDFVD